MSTPPPEKKRVGWVVSVGLSRQRGYITNSPDQMHPE